MQEIEIPSRLVRQIIEHALASPAHEVCGLIGARDGRPASLYRIPNAADTPELRFEMEPRAQIAAFKQMRGQAETLFAIYHSHPASAPRPSATDIAEAAYPEAAQLIVSLEGKEPALRAYRIANNAAEPLRLIVRDA